MSLSLESIEKDIGKLSANNPDTVEFRSIGLSSEGRDINAVYITDKRVALAEKEIAVVMGLRHGLETIGYRAMPSCQSLGI